MIQSSPSINPSPQYTKSHLLGRHFKNWPLQEMRHFAALNKGHRSSDACIYSTREAEIVSAALLDMRCGEKFASFLIVIRLRLDNHFILRTQQTTYGIFILGQRKKGWEVNGVYIVFMSLRVGDRCVYVKRRKKTEEHSSPSNFKTH